jgi:hypothetical protein
MSEQIRSELELLLHKMLQRIEIEGLADQLAATRKIDIVGLNFDLKAALRTYTEQGIIVDDRIRSGIVSEIALHTLSEEFQPQAAMELADVVPTPPDTGWTTTPNKRQSKATSVVQKIVLGGIGSAIFAISVVALVVFYRVQHDGVSTECAIRDLVDRHITEIRTCPDAIALAQIKSTHINERMPR